MPLSDTLRRCRPKRHCPTDLHAASVGTSSTATVKMKTAVLCFVLALAGIRQGDAITAGSVVKIEDHPYQVAIDYYTKPASAEDDDPSHVTVSTSSGALITDKTVITSGSSLVDDNYKVVDYLLHPAYQHSWTIDGDVLLLYLGEQVPTRPETRPVPLADPSRTLVPGERLVLTGYGNLTEGEVLADGEVRQLQAAALPFVNQEICGDIWGFYGTTTVRACAGGLAKDACGQGDQGAPLVNWRGELVGVASPQLEGECGVLGQPTVFTSLLTADMQQWIKSNANGKQPEPTSTPVPSVVGARHLWHPQRRPQQ
ncbi:hypothetical protein FOCC_FOCC011652 [Frankliniella occidentalis]|nr:hypothetical protein FOCC_FOCC011652 [Frankliniella occidentalis]